MVTDEVFLFLFTLVHFGQCVFRSCTQNRVIGEGGMV